MKVYFAHSMKDYGSRIEMTCIKLIRKKWPNAEVVNPKDYTPYFGSDMELYLEIVSGCDFLVFKRWNGYITAGVGKEIKHAWKLGKKVYEIKGSEIVEREKGTIPEEDFLSYEETIIMYELQRFEERWP